MGLFAKSQLQGTTATELANALSRTSSKVNNAAAGDRHITNKNYYAAKQFIRRWYAGDIY